MIKNKYLLFLSFLILFLFLIIPPVLAIAIKLEAPINGFSCPASGSCLSQYVTSLFSWAISIAGVIAVVSFAIGAVGLIISGDNPELAGNSKDRMKNAILGLVLTMASWLILTTINIDLPKLEVSPVATTPTLKAPILPGVYFYSGADCKLVGSGPAKQGPYTVSQNIIGIQLAKATIKSIEIVEDTANNINYGVILHKEFLLTGGECSLPITTAGCQPASISPSSADIFVLNPRNPNSADSSDVNFYSETFGQNGGVRGGRYPGQSVSSGIKANTMCFDYTGVDKQPWQKYKCENSTCHKSDYTCNSDDDCYNGEACDPDTNTCVGEDGGLLCSKAACETFQDCPSAITINGSYLVALYSKNPSKTDPNALYCQTFTKNTDNLNAQPFVPTSGKKLDSVYILHTQ